jgi:PKD repeat protein
VNPVYNSSKTASICQGNSYTLPNGKVVTLAGTYKDTLLSKKGCDSIITTTITVNPVYNSSKTASICKGSSYTLPKGEVATVAGTYKDTLLSKIGCDSIVTTNLTVNPKPSAPTVTYVGNILTSNIATGNQWFEASWGAYTDSTNQTFVAKVDGNYYDKILSNGCYSDSSNIINYSVKGIKADFSYTDSANVITFTDQSTTINATSYYWRYGDGMSGTGKGGTHAYKNAGTYNVCLTILDNKLGITDKMCKNVIAGSVPCNITAGYSYDVTNLTIRLKDNSAGGVARWYWNFGDDMTSTQKDPVHTFSEAGFYLISLTVSNATNKCADNYFEMIEVGQAPCHADFDYVVSAGSLKTSFTNNSTGLSPSYYWDFNDGSSTTAVSPVHTFGKAGNYQVSLTVATSNFGCVDNTIQSVEVGSVTCNAGFTYYVDSLNTAYFIENMLIEQNSVLWNFGDGGVSTVHNPSYHYQKPGYYTVSLSNYNKTGPCMDYNESDIMVGNPGTGIKSGFTYVADTVKKQVTFTDQSKGAIQYYIWNFGDGQPISKLENPVHPYNKSGYYNVCLLVIDENGNSDISCKKVGFSTGSAASCEADFAFIINDTTRATTFVDKSLGNPNNWAWNFGDKGTGTVQNPLHTYTTDNYYLVSLQITNTTSKCTSKTYKLLSINENKGLKVGFGYDAEPYSKKAGGYPVDFVGAGLGDQSRLKWDFGDGSIDTTTTSPVHVYDNAGQYTVCYIAVDDVTGQTDTACEVVQTTTGTLVSGTLQQGNNLGVYPNPFNNSATISYELAERTTLELALYDFSGRKVKTIVKTTQDKGTYTINWDARAVETGSYLLQLKTSGGTAKSLLLVKQR